jgi:tRNA U34 2-thiouridine synthase MnmA/TrmU
MIKTRKKTKAISKKAKAIVLFSGGLDSRLAVCMLKEQGIDIKALHFKLPFGAGCCNDTMCNFRFSQKELLPLEIIDCTAGRLFQEFMEVVKNPKHGHGSGMNPCIDCRIFMLKIAKEVMEREKADFVATGEVLNERPMSQYKSALELAENESGLKGRILRPLSAKLLPKTEAEEKKLVDREKMLAINGRSRKIQIELAKKFNITYPTPAGGCLLCDKTFSKKLSDLIEHQKEVNERDIELLKIGRHFRFGNAKIIVGRNERENKRLLSLKSPKDLIFETQGIVGPITLLIGKKPSQKEIETAASLTARYSDAKTEKNEGIKVQFGKKLQDGSITVKTASEEQINEIIIK